MKATNRAEAKSLLQTLESWSNELPTFGRTRVTNAGSKAANLSAMALKRGARGYRKPRPLPPRATLVHGSPGSMLKTATTLEVEDPPRRFRLDSLSRLTFGTEERHPG